MPYSRSNMLSGSADLVETVSATKKVIARSTVGSRAEFSIAVCVLANDSRALAAGNTIACQRRVLGKGASDEVLTTFHTPLRFLGVGTWGSPNRSENR